ncbi:HxsD-like protein [Oliverpabstia intestinalis]|uniref:HxsD-like protein n=1 Tax=Oliverpabstia intestinalis TaxID=2606633 RepID=UPI0026956FE3
MLMNKSMLNMDIYSVENIKKTCNAYKDFARIKIKRNYNYMELTFDRCKYDTDITIKEFENYLINIENMKK